MQKLLDFLANPKVSLALYAISFLAFLFINGIAAAAAVVLFVLYAPTKAQVMQAINPEWEDGKD